MTRAPRPGTTKSALYRRWSSKADYDAFLRSEAFKSAVAWGRAEILRSRPKHRVYDDADQTGRPARHHHSLVQTWARFWHWRRRQVHIDIIRYEQVQLPVAVHIGQR